ncbi:hypothetical protein JCM9152_2674 [Halalkalibacter hemicellulosilyticusJCM 9152]|uniref:Tetratricopeptide repeat protein n=1 Tax=Halalkalibacter hemicellulosilyticusJCM 9152 TaxID=1236971 RepID=W4QIP7_9BACI|nr:hypothetical protein JCM9152_2674 [Halalkalibacter hemicellulosilyticusJCM 9152]
MLTQESTKLQAFAMEMKKGFDLLQEGQYEEALRALKPFIELMRQGGAPHIRLFVSYGIAQFRTGDMEGFLETYGAVKEMKTKNDEEERLKSNLDQLFETLMSELEKEQDHP